MLAVVPALRQTQGKWNVRRRFVEKALGAGVVIPQVFAVIGGIDDKGIVENAHILQSGEDAAHIVVDLRDDAVVGGARGAYDLGRHQVERLLLSRQPEGVGDILTLAPVAVDRLGDVAIAVHRVVGFRRVDRRMGFGKGAPKEEGSRGVTALADETQHTVQQSRM